MEFTEKEITLKNGKTAILRSPTLEDAEDFLAFFTQAATETPFLLRSPEDPPLTVEAETQWIQSILQSEAQVVILCLVDGKIAGNCLISFSPKKKIRHRGRVGIALLREYWGNHIGSILFEEMISIARQWNLTQLELEFVEGNERARGLYEKMGFRFTGEIPNAIRLTDGTMLKEFQMVRSMGAGT